MFSDIDIKESILSGDLFIDPFSPSQIRPAGITFHLGYEFLRAKKVDVIDIKNSTALDYDKIRLKENEPLRLNVNDFILAQTLENVTVSNKIGFMIEGRSTLARLGITVVQTAMIVDSGHINRCITLEIKNNGTNDILLYPKMKIAKAVIFHLITPASTGYDSDGKYRKQSNVGKPILNDEF